MMWAPVTFKCSRCGAAFADAEGLKVHALSEHAHLDGLARQARLQPAVTLSCSRCGTAFASSEQLRDHALEHRRAREDQWRQRTSSRRQHGAKHVVSAAAVGQTRRLSAAEGPRPPGPRPPGAPPTTRETQPVGARPQDGLRPRPLAELRAAESPSRARTQHRGAVVLVAAVMAVLLGAASALAWWTTSIAGSGSFSTGTWGNDLAFCPGSSQALHFEGPGCGRWTPIATWNQQGEISLDFGDTLPNTRRTWCDVLRVTSSAPTPLHLVFLVDGAVASFVRGVALADGRPANVVGPNQTKSVAIRLVVPRRTAPGTYDGVLTVVADGETERHVFPMTLEVVAQRPQPSPILTFAPNVVPTPTTPPTASPTPTWSPTPSPSPSPTFCPLFTLVPGLSTTLPDATPGAPPQPVARVLPDGTLELGLGQIPVGYTIVFEDGLRMASTAGEAADVALAVAGPASDAVLQVGFWDDALGVVCDDLTLAAGSVASLALVVSVDPLAALGVREGTLTVSAQSEGGLSQQWVLPLTLTVVPAVDVPSAEPSPSIDPGLLPIPSLMPSAGVPAPAG